MVGQTAVRVNDTIPTRTADSGFVTGGDIPTLGGNFVCQNNPASCSAVGVSISGNMTVNGNKTATVDGNSVGGNVQVSSNGSAQVENNQISGCLTCTGNTSLRTSGNK